MPLPGPPLESDQGVRRASHSEANRMWGFCGSNVHVDRTGVLVFVENLVQVLPPSVVRRRRVLCWVRRGAQRGDESDIGIVRVYDHLAIARESFRPTYFQDLPASTDFQTPSPFEMLRECRLLPCPHKPRWDRTPATAMLPIDGEPSLSKIADQVLAPSVDFHHSTAGGSEIVGGWVARNSGGGQGTSATKRADGAVLHSPEERVFILVVFIFVVFRRRLGGDGGVFLRASSLRFRSFCWQKVSVADNSVKDRTNNTSTAARICTL